MLDRYGKKIDFISIQMQQSEKSEIQGRRQIGEELPIVHERFISHWSLKSINGNHLPLLRVSELGLHLLKGNSSRHKLGVHLNRVFEV
jgi:hypothetical protein